MKFLNFKNNRQKGISSIVGGIFFLVLMTSGFTVYYIALDTQSQMLDNQQIIADSEVAKIKEKFVVAASSSGVNNLLSLQVVNTGNNVVEIADVWIINKTGIENATRYDLDYRDVSIPVGYSGNILSNTPLYLISDIYDIKVISSIGTIQAVEYDVAGGSNVLRAQMVAIPQDVRFGENATITLIVTNTGDFPIDTVTANDLDVTPDQCTADPNPIFVGPTNLSPSQSTMFFWDCILNPPIGNEITFTGNATGLLSGVPVDSNNAFDTVTVRDFTSGGTLILEQELLSRPEIFMTIPSPFGDEKNEEGLWGINIVNPTPAPMDITKVTLTAISSRPQQKDKFFDAGSCSTNTVPPTPDSWSCPVQNQLMWQNYITPIQIPAYSVFPFNVKVETGELANSGDVLETILVTANVHTTLGQFGKAGYGSSMDDGDSSIANVFLSSVKDLIAPANIMTNMTGILSQTPTTFYATIADFETSTKYEIEKDSRLIINVPRGWTGVTYPLDPDFTISDTTFLGQTQIIGVLTADLASGGKSLEFTATAPCVQTTTKMYVMYLLADGTVSEDDTPHMALGPLSEVILQVVPNGPCT